MGKASRRDRPQPANVVVDRNPKEPELSFTAASPNSASPSSPTVSEAEHPTPAANSGDGFKAPSTLERPGGLASSSADLTSGERTELQAFLRQASLLTAFALLISIVSLLLHLTTILLTPLFNTIPLTIHRSLTYVLLALLPTAVLFFLTRNAAPRDIISPRVCIGLVAMSADLLAVRGRWVGSVAGRWLGPEWGAVGASVLLGVGVVGGGMAFAALCREHVLSIIPMGKRHEDDKHRTYDMLKGCVLYAGALYFADRLWSPLSPTSILLRHPEKTILMLSLLITFLSLFLRPLSAPSSPPAHRPIARTMPLSLLLRLPLLILAVRQQLFLPSKPPYLAAANTLRVLSSEKGVSGQVLVGEHLAQGYRFLRCDHSLLGGRWMRREEGGGIGLGESIFATFPLQEVGILAHRSDELESLERTLTLTTPLRMRSPSEEPGIGAEKDRVLIIGLGVGITAQSFHLRSHSLDIVELDPAVHRAATKFFDLSIASAEESSSSNSTLNLMDGAAYVHELAERRRRGEMDASPKWGYVVQDCFTGGQVPVEVFTMEFWADLQAGMVKDGLVAVNFVGLLNSKASRAVIVTLLKSFEQCRAFGDGHEAKRGEVEIRNMVIFCSMALNPILTFRPPTSADTLDSPIREHVYRTFLPHEVYLDEIVQPKDWSDEAMTLRRGGRHKLDGWQKETAMASWHAMQQLLTREMWMAW